MSCGLSFTQMLHSEDTDEEGEEIVPEAAAGALTREQGIDAGDEILKEDMDAGASTHYLMVRWYCDFCKQCSMPCGVLVRRRNHRADTESLCRRIGAVKLQRAFPNDR